MKANYEKSDCGISRLSLPKLKKVSLCGWTKDGRDTEKHDERLNLGQEKKRSSYSGARHFKKKINKKHRGKTNKHKNIRRNFFIKIHRNNYAVESKKEDVEEITSDDWKGNQDSVVLQQVSKM